MDWLLYAVVLPGVLLTLALAACAFHWAVKHGQVRELWLTLRSLVDRSPPDESDGELVSPATAAPAARAPSQS